MTQANLLRCDIRWMIRRDLPHVLQIEYDSYQHGWTEADFIHCLRQRHCIGMVAEHGIRVVGFMVYELYNNRLHILNFAVDPTCRHTGVATQMVDKLVAKLSTQRRTFLTLEIRETNVAGQLFFRDRGFKAIKVLHGHYPDTDEDAYVMQFEYHGTD